MALINCSECGGTVSDKAVSCPHCGNPINVSTKSIKPLYGSKTRVRRYRRLPNGYGQIRNLGGRRRKPYAVYPPVKDYHDNGTPVQQPAIGYFATYQEAMECLTEFNKVPFDVVGSKLTFAQVYEMFFENKFNNGKKELSNQSMRSCNAAFKNMSALHDKTFSKLRTSDFQAVIDKCPLKHASLELMVNVLKNMGKFALERDIIKKDYTQFVKINVPDDDEKGVPFTEEEIKKLWEHKDNQDIQIMLILLYSGMRISELKTIKIDFEKGIMVGGVKTKAGKGRTIPIHAYITDFLRTFDASMFEVYTYRLRFHDELKRIGIHYSSKGTKHTPHDLRHTFSWLADKYKMDPLAKHLIMGHTLSTNDVELSVYGHRTDEQLISEINKIKH